MSCCNHSHAPMDENKKCCDKKPFKGKALLLFFAIFAFGFLAGKTVELPEMKMKESAVNHEGHDMAARKYMPKNIYDGVMKNMHEDMMIEPTGNADIDFVKGMIPHHQGAIDMAKIVARKGSDPEIKTLAAGIIDAQKKEISMMREWLKGAEKKFKAEQDAKAKEEKEKAAAKEKANKESEEKK